MENSLSTVSIGMKDQETEGTGGKSLVSGRDQFVLGEMVFATRSRGESSFFIPMPVWRPCRNELAHFGYRANGP